jgi:hypothetical protein
VRSLLDYLRPAPVILVDRRPPTVPYQETRQAIADATGRAEMRWNGPPAGCERSIDRVTVFGGNPGTVQPILYLRFESPGNVITVAPVSDSNVNEPDNAAAIPIPTGADIISVWTGLVVGTVVTCTLWGVTQARRY